MAATSHQPADLGTSLARHILGCQNPDGGWGYAPGKRSRLEPTCWALLGLRAGQHDLRLGVDVLSRWPRHDGLLVDVATAPPNVAFNGLAALTLLELTTGTPEVEQILSALAAVSGRAVAPSAATAQDNSLRGWPWLPSTFSWVEPTALCCLAFKKAALNGRWNRQPGRIDEASRMLADRASGSGGWNYGNRMVFGKALPPQVPTTALALLALQDRQDDPVVGKGLAWLEDHATAEQSPLAMGLALTALETLGQSADDARHQLETKLASGPVGAHGLLGLGIALYALTAESDGHRAFRLGTVAS